MGATLLLQGFIVGFALAVPIGPIGILGVRKTLTEGQARGLVIGLGAATADMLFSSVAAFGLTVISSLFSHQMYWLRPVGGTVLLIVGIRIFRAHPPDPSAARAGGGLFRTYASTVLLTITNPLTMFGFLAVFAAMGLGHDLSIPMASTLIAGVFAGSFGWFVVLTSSASAFRNKLDVKGLRWVNRVAGALIIVSSFIAFFRPT